MQKAVSLRQHQRLREFIGLLVGRVKVTGDGGYDGAPNPSARPFVAAAETCFWRPRTDSGPQYQRSVLDWYLEVG